VLRIVFSVVVDLIGNTIIVCYFIFTSKYEISVPVTFKALTTINNDRSRYEFKVSEEMIALAKGAAHEYNMQH